MWMMMMAAMAAEPNTVSLEWLAPTCGDDDLRNESARRARGACGSSRVERWTYQYRVSRKSQGCEVWTVAWCEPSNMTYVAPGDVTVPTLYSDKEFKGTALAIPDGDWELQQIPIRDGGVWNDKAGSVRVPSGWTVRLCQEPGGGGRCADFKDDTPELHKTLVGNDAASYVMVVRGEIAPAHKCPLAFEHDNFKGRSLELCDDMLDMRGGSWNDKFNSVMVPPGWQVELCANPLGAGACKVADGDISRLGTTVVGSDKVSSVRIIARR